MSQPVAFVTGASTGIGFETARKLAAAGFTVYAGARRVEKMEPLKAYGVNVVALDVTDEESMAAAVGGVLAVHGRIDVLVNNAGYGSYGSLEEVEPAEGRRQFDVNVFGLARMTQLVIPGMRAARRGQDHQRVLDRRQDVRAARRLVPRDEVCRRGPERLAAARAQTARHRRVHHRACRHPVGVGRHFGAGAAGKLRARALRCPGQSGRGGAGHHGQGRHLDAPGGRGGRDRARRHRARPKTRYPVGPSARGILLLRRLLPDRAFDAVLWNIYKRFPG